MAIDDLTCYKSQLAAIRNEHRNLDQAVALLENTHPVDQLQLKRMKKKKLLLRDQIRALEAKLSPSSIA